MVPLKPPGICHLKPKIVYFQKDRIAMKKKRIGFVGLGLMGAAMAARLQKKDHLLIVHNRTREKASPLLSSGAQWAGNPGEVGSQAEIVFSMLSTPEVLRDVSLGSKGILGGLREGGIHIDCSTVSPSLTRELEREYAVRDRAFVHCPVLGSVPQAADGILLLFAGGASDAVSKVEPVLSDLGSKIWKFPRAEDASYTKLVCNLFIAGAITTLGQALVLAEKASLQPGTILDIIEGSAMASPMYRAKGKSMIEGNYAPRFYVEHMLKDVTLMIDAAAEKGVKLPTIEIARELLSAAEKAGLGKEDYSSVYKILKEMPPNR